MSLIESNKATTPSIKRRNFSHVPEGREATTGNASAFGGREATTGNASAVRRLLFPPTSTVFGTLSTLIRFWKPPLSSHEKRKEGWSQILFDKG